MDKIFQYLKQQLTKENSTILSVVVKIIEEESSPQEQEIFVKAFSEVINHYKDCQGELGREYNSHRVQWTDQLWIDIKNLPFTVQTHLRNLNNALWAEGAKKISWNDKLKKYYKSGGIKFKNKLKEAGLI